MIKTQKLFPSGIQSSSTIKRAKKAKIVVMAKSFLNKWTIDSNALYRIKPYRKWYRPTRNDKIFCNKWNDLLKISNIKGSCAESTEIRIQKVHWAAQLWTGFNKILSFLLNNTTNQFYIQTSKWAPLSMNQTPWQQTTQIYWFCRRTSNLSRPIIRPKCSPDTAYWIRIKRIWVIFSSSTKTENLCSIMSFTYENSRKIINQTFRKGFNGTNRAKSNTKNYSSWKDSENV